MTSVAEKLAQKSTRKTAAKQVRLRLVHVDFWSAVKLSFLIGVVCAIITLVAVILLWTVLVQTGVFESINSLLNDVSGKSAAEGGIAVESFLPVNNVLMFTLVVVLLNLVGGVALAAVVAFLYNLSVRLTGGLLFGFTNG